MHSFDLFDCGSKTYSRHFPNPAIFRDFVRQFQVVHFQSPRLNANRTELALRRLAVAVGSSSVRCQAPASGRRIHVRRASLRPRRSAAATQRNAIFSHSTTTAVMSYERRSLHLGRRYAFRRKFVFAGNFIRVMTLHGDVWLHSILSL